MMNQQDDFYQDQNIASSEGTTSYNPALIEQMGHESLKLILSSPILRQLNGMLEDMRNSYKNNRYYNKEIFDHFKKSFLFALLPFVSRDLWLSDLEEEDVRRISYNSNKSIIYLIFNKLDYFSFDDKKVLINFAYSVIYPSCRRPYKGGERKVLRDTQQTREVLQRIEGKSDKKGGWKAWFSKF